MNLAALQAAIAAKFPAATIGYSSPVPWRIAGVQEVRVQLLEPSGTTSWTLSGFQILVTDLGGPAERAGLTTVILEPDGLIQKAEAWCRAVVTAKTWDHVRVAEVLPLTILVEGYKGKKVTKAVLSLDTGGNVVAEDMT